MTDPRFLEPHAITARLRAASELANLDPARSLDAKIDLRPEAITTRLRLASELHELCAALSAAGKVPR